MADFVIAPPPVPVVPVEGETGGFPVRRILCVGRNYTAHRIERGGDDRDPPIFFTKPADAVVPPGRDAAYPPRTNDLHHEIELVVAIGTGGTDIAVETALDAGYGIFSSATEMRWARLRFNAYKARWVSQEQWHPRQRASLCDDGSMLLEVPYHDPRELAMDVLKHGGDCEVIEPPELRALVVAQARAVLDRHAD